MMMPAMVATEVALPENAISLGTIVAGESGVTPPDKRAIPKSMITAQSAWIMMFAGFRSR